MRVVVTGGSGRLGRSVVRELVEHGNDVLNADRQPFRGDPSSRFMPVDFTEFGQAIGPIAAHQPETVIHLAAIAEPRYYPEEVTFRNNVLAAFNVMQAAVSLGVRRVIYASSPNPIGWGAPNWAPKYLPIDEQHPDLPWHAYNLSKLIGQQIGDMFHNQTAGEFRAIYIRPCFVIAPEEWSSEVPTQGGGLLRDRFGQPKTAGIGLFSYVDARDAAQLFRLALEKTDLAHGETFYAAAADALTETPLCDVVPTIYPAAAEAARALTGSSPAVSTEKARRVLGYAPRFSWRTEMRSSGNRR